MLKMCDKHFFKPMTTMNLYIWLDSEVEAKQHSQSPLTHRNASNLFSKVGIYFPNNCEK